MNRLVVVIWLALVVLVTVVTGCTTRYDSRLIEADNLMQSNPDSALALIEAVTPADLTTEGDRAYRDLLLTQARYKCYITATSDSAINRALDYYRQHKSECEKLTRALIYKGAVMEELGYPDSAMCYYKQAEASAAPDDYFNLGYSKLRMGVLLRDYHSIDGMEIPKFEEALDFFMKTDNIDYQHKCLNNLGCALRDSDPKRAEPLLKQALDIAQHDNDTANVIEDLHALIVLFYYQEQYDQALDLVKEVEKWSTGIPSFTFCTTAADVYARNGMVDSAQRFLNLASSYDYSSEARYRVYILEAQAEISLAMGDSASYLSFMSQEARITDSLIANPSKPKIIKTDKDFDRGQMESDSRLRSRADMLTYLLLGAVAIIMLFLGYRYWRSLHRYHQIIKELKRESGTQLANLDELQHDVESMKIKDVQARDFVASQLEMLCEISVACYHEPRNKLSNHIKRIIKFQDDNRLQWAGIYDYIDAEYNHIMSRTRELYPDLNDKELLLLALTCLKFSHIQAAIILGYSNPTSVGTMKLRLCEKMKIDGSLQDYIDTMTKVNNEH